MPVSMTIVRCGESARSELARWVDGRKRNDRLAPVTVVVRSTYGALDLRRRLARTVSQAVGRELPDTPGGGAPELGRTGIANVRLLVITRLAELLGAPAMTRGLGGAVAAPLSQAALLCAIELALAEDPGVFVEVAEHGSTASALARTYRELRRLNPSDRIALSAGSARARDVVRLVERAEELCRGRYYDRDDIAAAAADEVRGGRAPLGDIGPVALYLPDEMRPREIDLVAALAKVLDVTVLIGATGDERADEGARRVRASLSALGAELEDSGAPVATSPGGAPAPRFHEIVRAADPEAEAVEAVRLLIDHASAGGDLGRCAVALASPERYARLLAERIESAGLPWNGRSPMKLAEVPWCRALSGLVDLGRVAPSAHGRPGAGAALDRAQVIAWLASGPVVAPDGGRVPVGAWDRCSRRAGVVSGLGEWRSRLDAERERADGLDEEGAVVATELRAFVDALGERLAGLSSCTGYGAFAEWLERAGAEVLAPLDETVAALVDQALGELAALDDFGPIQIQAPEGRLATLSGALRAVLDRPAPRSGRFGVGPCVGSIGDLAGLETELLVVLGAVEGSLPGRAADDPLLPRAESERAGLGLLVPETRPARDRRELALLLAGAAKAVATVPRLDHRNGRAAIASRWLDGDLAVESVRRSTGSTVARLRAVGSAAVPACDETELEVAELVRFVSAGGDPLEHFLARLFPSYTNALEARSARAGRELSRFSGYVALMPGAEGSKAAAASSASALEQLARCPFQGFLARQLDVEVIDAPERVLTVGAADRGLIVHEILELLVRELLEHGPPQSWGGWTDQHRHRARVIGASVFQRFERGGRSGKALFWEIEKRRIEDAVDSFLLRDAETIRTEHRVPLFAELGFGDGDSPAVSVQVAGSELFLKGKIDRIDRVRALSRGDGDGVVVVDYKTGKHDQYSGLKRDPTDRGRHLQPTLYALAAEQLLGDAGGPATQVVRSELQFVGSRSAAPLTVVLDDGARRELGEVLGIITRLKVHGIFPARPGGEGGHSPDNCEHCDFDSVCPVDRGRAWDRIKADPLVERYAALAEPADEEPADPGADFAGRDGDLPPVQSAADAAHSGSGPADE